MMVSLNLIGATEYVYRKNLIMEYTNLSWLYLAEWIFADGQAYAPTQFGESKNGVWIPKDPTGTTFGNNDIYLKI